MSEHVYDNASYDEEVKRGRQVEMVLNVYENTDAIRGRRTNTETENSNTTRNQQVQPSDTQVYTAWCRWYRLTAVCVLLLLCFLLATGVTVLWIKFNILNMENNQLQTKNKNLTTERDQLQASYKNQTIEKEQLQSKNKNLTIERDQLQASYNNQTIEKEQLQSKNKNLTIERDELWTSYNSMQNRMAISDSLIKEGWIQFSYSFYYFSTDWKNWTESRRDCKERGADLVIINSTEEQEFINKLMSYRPAWIGLNYREDEWMWVDDTPLSTEFQGRGEPDGTAGDEDCVIINYYYYYRSHYYDFDADYPCDREFMWICEKTIFN